ncbi:MAG: choice-of-anchor I family protein [Spirochaetes bacterium]|uniref:Choice-of-anchor I family protein n=1 Tax=Candidatus Ornithospirochaeta stercoripullorum TaxID=2840899 RepID=A0A9D9DYV9_9SPIO|nr:choice-of-anchor I family protein [Candidatus Ornithospirochaeta stercoripullorum]
MKTLKTTAVAVTLGLASVAALSAAVQTEGYENGKAELDISMIAHYSANETNTDGGVMEIVDYNPSNGFAYAVNGQKGVLTAISYSGSAELSGRDIDVKAMVESDDFAYGDMTSVAVSPDGSLLAVALQDEAYDKNGRIALFACNADGSIALKELFMAGIQPDMVTFSPDGKYILSADEGEPREGYESVDPAGSVTVVDIANSSEKTIGFESFDSTPLYDESIIMQKGTLPSRDFEPEYIAVSGNNAYITLQEANAIAVLDLETMSFSGIYSAGFEDYAKVPVDIDKKDDAYAPKVYENLKGIRMPDGIAAFTVDGKTYLVTANEGDAREWGDYLNEDERDFGDGDTSPTGRITAENSSLEGKVVFLASDDYNGLNEDTDYLYGGRSLTIYEVTETGLSEVFTSADDAERITFSYLPDYYNSSNDNAVLDDRSGKKGPEAEAVTTGVVDGRTYAFLALERTGGIMVYDVTEPSDSRYINYINTRDFETIIPGTEVYEDGELDKWVTGGDVAPEGLEFVPASDSPTGNALLIVAFEVSGTVAVYELH